MPQLATQPGNSKPTLEHFSVADLIKTFSRSTSVASAPSRAKEPAVPQPQATRRIVLSLPDRKLTLPDDGRVVMIYDVAFNANPSPGGESQIAEYLSNPTDSKPGLVIGPSSGLPLGTRGPGLNRKGFGIHDANRPASVGKNGPHGCLRPMWKISLPGLVGDRVSLLAERTEEVAQPFGGDASATAISNEPSQVDARRVHKDRGQRSRL